jgi:hypothetical protein
LPMRDLKEALMIRPVVHRVTHMLNNT